MFIQFIPSKINSYSIPIAKNTQEESTSNDHSKINFGTLQVFIALCNFEISDREVLQNHLGTPRAPYENSIEV